MDFNEAFDRVISHEGGYVDDKNDPGGETNWGISKRSYPSLDIKNLTREEAKEIYRQDFWGRLPIDDLGEEVGFHLFDLSVNSGVATAIRLLQRAIGVADDGEWGPVSQAKAMSLSSLLIIMALSAERLDFMTRLKNWPNHGKGWARRIVGNLKYASQETNPT